MAGLKKARRLKEKAKQGKYKMRDMQPQATVPAATPTPDANPFLMGTATYGTPPKE